MPNAPLTRAAAAMHVAMFEAAHAPERRYRPYKLDLQASRTASRDAAVATAAHDALVALHPDRRQPLDEALATALALVAEGAAKAAGVELGKRAAIGVPASRADDGIGVPESYRPVTRPGVYVSTTVPIESTSGGIRPWVLHQGAQVRPPPPPALNSEVWTRDLNEVRELGGLRSTRRTAEQTEIGRFWFLTGPRAYAPLIRQVSATKKMDLVESVRLHALVSMATSDAFIAVFDAEYAYNFWRPITAIRNSDQTNNPVTPREASWLPLGITPLHPEYPCAHCIVSSAVAEVLQRVAGDDVGELSLTNSGPPAVTRRWRRLQDYSDEVALARIYAGFHYRFSAEAAKTMGRKIGELTATTQLLVAAAPVGK